MVDGMAVPMEPHRRGWEHGLMEPHHQVQARDSPVIASTTIIALSAGGGVLLLVKANDGNANRTIVNVKVVFVVVTIINAVSISNVEGATRIPRPQTVGVRIVGIQSPIVRI